MVKTSFHSSSSGMSREGAPDHIVMSRRSSTGSVGRSGSPENVFARRSGEIPYQIYFEISNIGRNVESSKKRARWKFCFGEEGREHEVTLVHSLMSGKKKTLFNGECINEAQKVAKEWSFAWSHGAHLLRVGINFEEYSLVIDGIAFRNFTRRDPYLAAQLEATKRDSMRSLQSDEQRRFERLGYTGGNMGTRSRTAEPRRPSQVSSTNSNGSRSSSVSRAVSTGRSRGGDREESARRRRSPSQGTPALSRRSSSVEMRDDGRTSPTPAVRRSSSSKRLQSGAGGGGAKQSGGAAASRMTNGKGSRAVPAAAPVAVTAPAMVQSDGDILSADPSTLEVKGFDMTMPESSFDPLNTKFGAAGGRQVANGGTGGGPHGPGNGSDGFGGTFSYGGGAGAFGVAGGGHGDTAAVLQIGMEFEAMGMNAGVQQHQQQYMTQQQPPIQPNPFDQGGYQQYDDSGFPLPVQTSPFNNAPLQQSQQQQHQNFGFAGGVEGGGGFPGDYAAQGQGGSGGVEGAQQGYSTGVAGAGIVASNGTELSLVEHKASNDPWEMARSGMVNIDDITDTKNKPKVEVKPFTNDHRPLADLVREAPVKEKKAVMMNRPEPVPTHMAVAIVPVQGGYSTQAHQDPFPQQQVSNGNPFNQSLQLTQYGHQAQPILYTKPDDPFFNL